MSQKKVRHGKHIPQRSCVGCREVLAKRTLIRIVRTPEGMRVDATGKAAGRGAYLHDRRICWEKALKGALAAALRTEMTPEDAILLKEFLASLPEVEPAGPVQPDSGETA